MPENTTPGVWRRATDEDLSQKPQQGDPEVENKAPEEPKEPQAQTPESPKAPEKPAEQPAAGVTVSDYWKQIGQKSGYEFQSEEQLIDELKSKRDLSTKITDYESKLKTFQDLDPLALDIDKAAKAGMDISTYMEARTMDVGKLQGKELLKREFMLKNQQLIKEDRDFALQKFERDYQKSFGVLDKKVDLNELPEEERAAIEDRLKDAEFELKARQMQAKGFLADWQSKNVAVPEPQKRGMTDEQIQQYYNQAETSVDDLETIELPIGDKMFKFGVDEYKQPLKEDLRNPVEALKKFGVDLEQGLIDPGGLTELLLAHYAMNDQKLFSELTKWHLEQNTESTVKKQTPPAPPNPSPGGGLDSQKSKAEQMAQIVSAQRKARAEAER